jgi:hypothetical protein
VSPKSAGLAARLGRGQVAVRESAPVRARVRFGGRWHGVRKSLILTFLKSYEMHAWRQLYLQGNL